MTLHGNTQSTTAARPQLTLIQPPILSPTYPKVPFNFEPLSLLTIASMTPPDAYSVRIIDAASARDIAPAIDLGSSLVGITVVNAAAPTAYKIASVYRQHGIPVILGGPHITLNPDDAAPHVDSVVIGEVEGGWHEILADFANGKLKSRYEFEPPDPIRIRVDRSFIPGYRRRYPFISAIQTTRGCPNGCEFCAAAACYGTTPRHRPVEDVVDEIRNLRDTYRRRTFGFTDDNIVGDTAYARELFRALIPLKIKWASQMCLDIAKDEELLDLAARSGCFAAFVGLESVSEETLRGIPKPCTVDEYPGLIEAMHGKGILLIASFIIGYDGDDEDVYERTLAFCRENKIEFPLFVPLMVEPGLPVYERLQRENRLVDQGERDGLPHIGFEPKKLDPATMPSKILEMYRKHYTWRAAAAQLPGCFRRGGLRKLVYLLASRFYFTRYLRDIEKSAGRVSSCCVDLPRPAER